MRGRLRLGLALIKKLGKDLPLVHPAMSVRRRYHQSRKRHIPGSGVWMKPERIEVWMRKLSTRSENKCSLLIGFFP
ncbi:MAG: hypothetical protein P4M11_02250 [Candidatus Pacebacteria bacterium]|nr:hypothetical protein [Candidatus Paceibacterota bacterium]